MKLRISGAALLLAFSSCGFLFHDLGEEDREPDFEGREKPEEGVTSSEVRARVITDARLRDLQKSAPGGSTECSDVVFGEEGPTCRKHETPLQVVDFPIRAEEGRYAVRERVFYCEEDAVYWYRWEKLEPSRVTWQGPFPSRLPKKKDG